MDFLPTSDDMRVDVKRVVDRVDGALPVVALAQIEGAVVQSRTSNVRVPADRRLRQSQILTDRQRERDRWTTAGILSLQNTQSWRDYW